MDNEKDINETEVWAKFSVTHHYQRDAKGIMKHVSSDYFQLDPFDIARPTTKRERFIVIGVSGRSTLLSFTLPRLLSFYFVLWLHFTKYNGDSMWMMTSYDDDDDDS